MSKRKKIRLTARACSDVDLWKVNITAKHKPIRADFGRLARLTGFEPLVSWVVLSSAKLNASLLPKVATSPRLGVRFLLNSMNERSMMFFDIEL